jgi:hypothetical protein
MQAKYEGVCWVSGCCLRVSGWCLGVSGRCLRCVDVISTEKSSITVIQITCGLFSQCPFSSKKGPTGDNFQGGVVGFISGSTANFFVLGGQVMDIGKQWGWCWRIFLTWPRYPPTLLLGVGNHYLSLHHVSVSQTPKGAPRPVWNKPFLGQWTFFWTRNRV